MAYNEEANIGRLLETVLGQEFIHGELKEIFVVASGCTDRTGDIVKNYEGRDKRIRLIVQPERRGKASAINLFLDEASGDVLILESGDTVPAPGTLDKLIAPFENPEVGMTGGRPIPVNQRDNFIGFTVHLMWLLHHKIALETPKLGELVAFRNFVHQIPQDTAVDEASIEAIIKEAGFKLRYIPDAIVRNKGPENMKDFLKQRRRIAAGHGHLKAKTNYEVSTTDPLKILRILFQETVWKPKETLWIVGAIALEGAGRLLGYYDLRVRKKNPFVWDIARSTKDLG